MLGERGEEEVMALQPAPAVVAGGQGALSAQSPLLAKGHSLWDRGAWTGMVAAISQEMQLLLGMPVL